jgi:hypothetical protein
MIASGKHWCDRAPQNCNVNAHQKGRLADAAMGVNVVNIVNVSGTAVPNHGPSKKPPGIAHDYEGSGQSESSR